MVGCAVDHRPKGRSRPQWIIAKPGSRQLCATVRSNRRSARGARSHAHDHLGSERGRAHAAPSRAPTAPDANERSSPLERGEPASSTQAVAVALRGALPPFKGALFILRAIRAGGCAFGRGWQRSIPRAPGIVDEPLPHDADEDLRFAFEVALRKRDNERDRLERIEGKVAPIIAGTIAALGLFLDKASGWLDVAVGALYLVPLWILLRTFQTYVYIDVPSLDQLALTWQRWPKTFLKATVAGAADALARNRPAIDKKARDLNLAMNLVYVVTVIVLCVRLLEGYTAQHGYQGTTNPASTTSSASAHSTIGPRNNAQSRHGH